MTFDPNNNPDHRWGTVRGGYPGSHRGQWKTHARLRDVRAALEHASNISVWRRWPGTGWVEVLRLGARERITAPGTDACHVCGKGTSDDWWEEAWSPDEDFAKVAVHNRCRRKLGVRR